MLRVNFWGENISIHIVFYAPFSIGRSQQVEDLIFGACCAILFIHFGQFFCHL